MRLTIDTKNKTIKVEESVNIDELNAELNNLLGDKFGDYTLLPIEYKWQYIPYYPNPTYWTAPTTVITSGYINYGEYSVPATLTTSCQ